VLAGILISAGLGIIDYRSFAHLRSAPRADSAVMLLVVALTIFTDLITAVGIGMVAASLVFMASIAGIMEQRTKLTLVEDEPWADEVEIPQALKKRLLIKHVDGPLFFGFAQALRKVSSQVTDGRMLVLRMERVSYMDQSGVYALQDVLVDLKAANLRVLLVGLPPGQIDRLEAMQVVPGLVPREDVFDSFDAFRRDLPGIIAKLG
jgi:SulP family sulfate permease